MCLVLNYLSFMSVFLDKVKKIFLLLGIVKEYFSACRLLIQLSNSKWRPYIKKINIK